MKTIILLITIIPFWVKCQTPGISQSTVLDGLYVKEHIPTKKVIQYDPLREADVMWSKRVWRTIDLREKMNFPLRYPLNPTSDRRSLWDVIKYSILTEGSLTPYRSTTPNFEEDDQFRYPILPPNGNINDSVYQNEIHRLFYTIKETEDIMVDANGDPKYDINGGEEYIIDTSAISSADILEYEIKEDWFFDKQRSKLDVRIIGICPVVKSEFNDVNFKEKKFWLYFPECRYVFQNHFVYNIRNDAQRMSFDDLFWKRMFSSYVNKETNVYNRKISSYEKNGVRALLESERIKEEMRKFEHDLWNL